LLEKFTRSISDKLQKLKQPAAGGAASDAENDALETTAPIEDDEEDRDENKEPGQVSISDNSLDVCLHYNIFWIFKLKN